jgi:hypothetical protein
MTLLSLSRVKLAWVAVLGALVLSSPTQAATIFENVWVPDNGGVCSFSTTCAAATAGGDDYAANQFSVGAATTALSASFTILDRGTVATAANWAIYADVAGSPGGSALFSGTSGIASTVHLGTESGGFYSVDKQSFNITPSGLGSGVYWLAIQAVSSDVNTFLALTAGGPSAETHDGGTTWGADYEGWPDGVAFGLYDSPIGATPLPAALPLFATGLGALGLLGWRRKRKVLAA